MPDRRTLVKGKPTLTFEIATNDYANIRIALERYHQDIDALPEQYWKIRADSIRRTLTKIEDQRKAHE